MVLRFRAVRNVKGNLPQRFSVVLASPQALGNQQHKCSLATLSFLSPVFYLKTVATPDASLYNSGRLIESCPSAFHTKFKMHARASARHEVRPVCAAFTLGDAPRFFSNIHGPRYFDWDMAIQKYWSFTESKRLQFRFEMFNALNHPDFFQPDTDVSSGNFGRITSAYQARTAQVAAKFYF